MSMPTSSAAPVKVLVVDDSATMRVFLEQTLNQRGIPDIALNKVVACVTLERLQVLQIARVGELVDVDHRLVIDGQPVQHEVGADEACAASNQNHGDMPGSGS